MTTRARIVVQYEAEGPLEFAEVDLPEPGPHQVMVALVATGVCHSQLHNMHSARNGPILFGHEGYGVVVATGSEVTPVTAGDEVIVTWLPRVDDERPRTPEHATVALPDGRLASSPNVFTWADHTIVDELYVLGVPEGARRDSAAIIGCAVVTGVGAVCNAAAVASGDTVAVFGIGGVGLSALVGAQKAGASAIVAVDLSDNKLELARRFGATDVVNASCTDAVARIRDMFPGNGVTNALAAVSGVDFAFDCVGIPATIRQALAAVRPGWFGHRRGGTAVLVGVPGQQVCLDPGELLGGDKTFLAALGGSCHQRELSRYLEWTATGELDLEAMITDRFPLARINDAVQALAGGQILGRALAVI